MRGGVSFWNDRFCWHLYFFLLLLKHFKRSQSLSMTCHKSRSSTVPWFIITFNYFTIVIFEPSLYRQQEMGTPADPKVDTQQRKETRTEPPRWILTSFELSDGSPIQKLTNGRPATTGFCFLSMNVIIVWRGNTCVFTVWWHTFFFVSPHRQVWRSKSGPYLTVAFLGGGSKFWN